MIPRPVADQATRLARVVARLGDDAWSADIAALGLHGGASPGSDGPPTYGDVARAGTDLVDALARGGVWDAAAVQSRHLRRFFFATGMDLGPIAAQAFDGLLAASLARDPDELSDFVELVEEMFP